MTKKQLTKEQFFAMSIFNVPGISSRALNWHVLRIAQERQDRIFKEARLAGATESDADIAASCVPWGREAYRHDPDLTLGSIIRRIPWDNTWGIFEGHRQIIRFALDCGLTRVDWLAVRYDEARVLEQLGCMRRDDVRALSVFVFGFITDASSWWLSEVCGVRDARTATIGQFLDCNVETVTRSGFAAVACVRLATLLRGLGFDAPVLFTGRERLVRSLMAEDQMSEAEAERFVEIGVRRGFIPKTQLV